MASSVYEPWFRLLLHGLSAARDAMMSVQLAEGLVEHDQAWSLWRARHALLAERQIGARTGTGGSTGVDCLRSREHEYFFPEPWAVRGEL